MNKTIVKGYKVFNSDWTCRDKQYTCPGKFEEDVFLSVCHKGMHFCKRVIDCFNYYKFDPKNKVAEVIAYGNIEEEGNKCCTNKLEIVREIPWAELLEIVNTGEGCTGFLNSGNLNSGNHNSGDLNSGNYNSGYRNSGNHNSGDINSGNYNSSDYNSGYYNSGCYNSGNYNSGSGNSGYRNSGNFNSGNYNSGSGNSGNCNSGDWNKCNNSSGCFNTVEQKIYLFNKPSNWTLIQWKTSRAYELLQNLQPTKFIRFADMTEEEKIKYPEAEVTGGYIKVFTETERIKNANDWWHTLSDDDKTAIMSIPNFDKEIFKEITGIDVDG